jgi:hypothetical protein
MATNSDECVFSVKAFGEGAGFLYLRLVPYTPDLRLLLC